MPLENPGKVINDIKITKAKIKITFLDGDKIELFPDVFTSFYLFKGKEISQKEYLEINKANKKAYLKNYAYSLFTKGSYSEKQIRIKLNKKKAGKKDSDDIISRLKEVKLIDDKEYALNLSSYMQEKGYGKNKVISKLYEAGISSTIIDSITFSNEEEHCLTLFNKFSKRIDDEPYLMKKKHAYDFLSRNGFDSGVIYLVIENNLEENKDKVKDKLKKDYNILCNRNKKLDEKEKSRKIISSLLAKGYRYEDIKEVIIDVSE